MQIKTGHFRGQSPRLTSTEQYLEFLKKALED